MAHEGILDYTSGLADLYPRFVQGEVDKHINYSSTATSPLKAVHGQLNEMLESHSLNFLECTKHLICYLKNDVMPREGGEQKDGRGCGSPP